MEIAHTTSVFFFFQAEDGIRDLVRSRGLGDVYKRQGHGTAILTGVLISSQDAASGDRQLPSVR